MMLTDELIAFVCDVRFEDLPAPVVETAIRCARDALGCIVGGARSEPGRIAADLVQQMGGAPQATLALRDVRLPVPLAAFAHATMANALDYEDTLFGHPASTVVPTVLALGEWLNVDGRAFITALVAGYEVSARVLSCARPLLPRYEAIWDLGTLQTYGVVAAAGKLLGLSPQVLRHAMGLAGATAPVPLARKPRALAGEGRSMIKSAYGWSVQSGIQSCLLARDGFTGPDRIFDGTMGFWEMGPSQSPRIAHLTDGLGERFLIEDVQFKPYPACRFLHPVLDGIRELVQAGVRGDRVQSVQVRGFHLLADEYHNIPRPGSVTDAQFSVPYCAAAMLLDGALRPEAFSPDRLRDPRLLDLASRVEVAVDPEIDAAFPQRLAASVAVTSRDGTQRQVRVDHPRGDPDRPLTDDELVKKFLMLAEPALGLKRAEGLAAMLGALPSIESVSRLAGLLGGV